MSRRNAGPRLRWLDKRQAFYICWTDAGRSRERSTGTQDRREAEIQLAEFIRSRTKRTGPRDPAEVLVTDVLTDYMTQRAPSTRWPVRIACAVEPLAKFFAGKSLAALNDHLVTTYGKWRERAQSTVRRELVILRAASNHSYRNHYITRPVPIALPSEGPGVPKGESRSQLVNNLDVVATMADWSHVTPTTVLDGRSLRPIIADSSASWRTAFLLEGTDGKYFHNREPYARYVAVRTSNGRTRRIYVEHESSVFGPEEELYDLTNDPYELRNVASKASYGSIISHLHRVLQKLSSCSGATCWFDRR